MPFVLATTAILASIVPGYAAPARPAFLLSEELVLSEDNPFRLSSTLPFRLPPFDRITNADYAPAFIEGMREALRDTVVIAENPAAATFDNTIVAMERSGALLTRVSTVFFNLAGANTNSVLEALELELAPRLAAHTDQIMLNSRLFRRVEVVYAARHDSGLD